MPAIQKIQKLFSGQFYLEKKKNNLFILKTKRKVFIISEWKQH